MTRSCRAVAARVLAATITGGQSLGETLAPALEQVPERDRALLQQLCYGSLRHYHRLDAVLRQLLRKPLKDKDGDINALLILGLYQILDMRIPDHASISTTVEASRELKKPWASGLINGVLRRCGRESDQLLQQLSQHQLDSHPEWLHRLLNQYWPEQSAQIIAANNLQPPMCLRVNRQRTSREDYLLALADADIAATACNFSADAVRLEQARDVRQLPGFMEGRVSVQDEGAQLAAELMGVQAGERVLDACAAPGGKTCHILERQPDLEQLWAVDIDENRLQRIQENLQRLNLQASLVQADASQLPEPLRQSRFDRVLLDAPCSGSGVIRRHPDIKLLRRESDLAGFAQTQLAILQSLWPLVRPGGLLLYVTCSILPPENDDVVAAFLEQQTDAAALEPAVSWGVKCAHGRQLLPAPEGPDGLYYAALCKAS